jgi:hypothetical protein
MAKQQVLTSQQYIILVQLGQLKAVNLSRSPTMYCDQPFVSETMRCVSNDFIEIHDNSGQNVVRFYV